jgi:hypothetical protein
LPDGPKKGELFTTAVPGLSLFLREEPSDIPVLAPIIQREIICRLFVGDQGAHLRQIPSAGSQSNKIARAIETISGR